jgi:putative cardiolipin synthase
MAPQVVDAMSHVQTELMMVTPYFVPSDHELEVLKELRAKNARVRILSNSLESAPELSAQSGYTKFRMPLLESGVEMYEIRALLDKTRGSGQTRAVSRYGNYALHAKLYIFDRRRLYIGSMNYDQRSLRINTETGLIIDSPQLAEQMTKRFESMTSPEEAYVLALRTDEHGHPAIEWRTVMGGRELYSTREPSRGFWQLQKVRMLSLLPINPEL